MTGDLTPAQLQRAAAVDTFLQRNREAVAAAGRGRLIIALDATMSRQPTWDIAIELQAEMFAEAAKVGGLQVQLVFFRDNECRASDWTANAHALADKMRRISCVAGKTQIARVLAHIRNEHRRKPISAAIFIGDAVEEEPSVLYDAAARLPPLFLFQEGAHPRAEIVFRELAHLTKGAYAKFDSGVARELADLLRAGAAFAAGGMRALTDLRTEGARRLLTQLK
jgi:hypothetical protein